MHGVADAKLVLPGRVGVQAPRIGITAAVTAFASTDHVMQADKGCDFDVLRKLQDEPFQTDPIGLDSAPH